jgi:tetratricopeptide (TPR) repeat protein
MKLEECYRSLGLAPGSSREQVKTAYRNLARKFHPDIHQDSAPPKNHKSAPHPDKFLQITAAYKFLLQSFSADLPVAPRPSAPTSNAPEDLLKYQAYQRLRQLFAQQRFANAIALVEALADRLPDDAEVQQWRAIAYQQQGRHLAQAHQYPQAMRYLQKALITNPTNRTLVATIHQDLKALQRRVKQVNSRSI